METRMETIFTGLYCKDCGQLQREDFKEKPCQRCSGVNMAKLDEATDDAPDPIVAYDLTDRDRLFLRVQRITP